MTSTKQRIRVIERKLKPKERVTTMQFRNKLFFAEKARRPICRGSFMIMTDTLLPITAYDEDDPYWLPLALKVDRRENNLDRLMQVFEDATAEQEERLEDIADSFEAELKVAEKSPIHFDMSTGKGE